MSNPAPPLYQGEPAFGYPPLGQGYPPAGQGHPQPKSHGTLPPYGQIYPAIPGQHPKGMVFLPGQGYPPPNGPLPQYGGAPYGQLIPAIPGQQPPQLGGGCPHGCPCTLELLHVKLPPLAKPVNTHMLYSIFTMLFCFQPLGIAAFIFSICARIANQSGDQLRAEQSSRISRTLNNVALGIGLTMLFLVFIYIYNFDEDIVIDFPKSIFPMMGWP